MQTLLITIIAGILTYFDIVPVAAFLFTVLIAIIWDFVSTCLYFTRGFMKFFFHDILRWHRPNDTRELAGINMKSTCKYCGKEIMQDSQGNWF